MSAHRNSTNPLKVDAPEFYRYASLKEISRIPPGKKVYCWGKLLEKGENGTQWTIRDHSDQKTVSVSPLAVGREPIKEGTIVRVFGQTSLHGLEAKRIIATDWEFEIAEKFFRDQKETG
ncbi:MAG TPA: hypothetical protein VJ044_17310 [Candidatus Hodarchaeales archaeon]|nr:hypothetical protein [Candidatus Hodarchaeales archaeon]